GALERGGDATVQEEIRLAETSARRGPS
ncbi:MAG: hypothetical protein H6Q86_4049, partial [candidate division NC10 bacterium]|nr:hypothetical protein [candidate division NC10 bacterium]